MEHFNFLEQLRKQPSYSNNQTFLPSLHYTSFLFVVFNLYLLLFLQCFYLYTSLRLVNCSEPSRATSSSSRLTHGHSAHSELNYFEFGLRVLSFFPTLIPNVQVPSFLSKGVSRWSDFELRRMFIRA